ncbi:hypothetical protein [Butyrivibrio sp. AC2005]|uniref:hypothetical protein n=1 Tax=Butyrivibrio sp. AC2005 TaxID=1280672 RepID=UPI000423A695|nr:hypothetical protein [Butyrivibrio sp. AC2005]
MDNENAWNFCVAGNIVKMRTDENGVLRHGTSGFSGGTKVYLQGKFWNEYHRNQGLIAVIGLSRGKRYECLLVPVDAIENVRFQRVFNPRVIDMMDDWEYASAWWHRTADDKREAKTFAEEWNKQEKGSEESSHISFERIASEEGCSPEERVEFDFTPIDNEHTNDAQELRKRLDSMKLQGRVISDIRFTSHVYNLTEDEIGETLWRETRGYPNDLHNYISNPQNVDDNFPFPMWFEMDEPLLIRFEDGDQFEIFTEVEECYYVGMNRIPWNAKGKVNIENVNGSILFDIMKGAVITDVEVVMNSYPSGEEYIGSVRIRWKKEEEYYLVIESECHDYMGVSLEECSGRIIKCPFSKIKQSLYIRSE